MVRVPWRTWGPCALVGRERGRREGGRGPLPFALFSLASFLFIQLCH